MSQTTGNSRLQKLLKLIDSGATLDTRKAAAAQVSRIVSSHPAQLSYVLTEVARHLRHRNWDARVAAGYCLGLMAQHFVHHTPADLAKAADIQLDALASLVKTEEDGGGGGGLSVFDVKRVLEQGTQLLASGGEEYDLNEAETLAEQRTNLKKRLGLGEGKMAEIMDTTDIFNDEDLVNVQSKRCAPQKAKRDAAALLDDMSGLSARERAAAASKAKAAKRSAGDVTGELAVPATKKFKIEEGGSSGGVEIEIDPAEDHWQGVVAGRWAFQDLCDRLYLDVLHPQWEVRHGAAIALRDILTSHAASAAVYAPVVADDPGGWSASEGQGLLALGAVSPQDAAAAAAANTAWLEDCMIHLLCTLALDRFADFVSDQVVAPVRETAAQALGVVSQPLDGTQVLRLVEALNSLTQCSEWQARHGGLLGLKYVVAVREHIDQPLLHALLPAVIAGLQDDDDDVRAVAAEALLPAAELLAADASPQGQNVVSLLWDSLLTLEDLSPATASIMTLIAKVYHASAQDSSSSTTTTPAQAASHLHGNLPQWVVHLWPLMRHTLVAVRQAVVNCLAALLQVCLPTDILPGGELLRAVRLLFQNLLVERDVGVRRTSLHSWRLLITKTPGQELVGALSQGQVAGMFILGGTPPNQPLNGALLEGGAKAATGSNIPDRAATRLDAARALGLLGHVLCAVPLPNNPVAGLAMEGMRSGVTSHRLLAGFVTAYWAQEAGQGAQRSEDDSTHLEQLVGVALQGLETLKQCEVAEVAPLLAQVRTQAGALITRALQAGLPLAAPGPIQSISVEGALALAAQIPSTAGATFNVAQALAASATAVQTMDSVLRASMGAALAAAVVHAGQLPAKLTTLVQPLIASVRREPQQAQQDEASKALAAVIVACHTRASGPVDKIVKNVCKFIFDATGTVPNVSKPPPLFPNEQQQGSGVAAAGRMASSALVEAPADDDLAAAVTMARRGGEAVLRGVATAAGSQLPTQVPALWTQAMIQPLEAMRQQQQDGAMDAAVAQNAVHALVVFQVIIPSVHIDLIPAMVTLLPDIGVCLAHSNNAVKVAAAAAVAGLASAAPEAAMPAVLRAVQPLLADAASEASRLGGLVALKEVVAVLKLQLVPYVQLAVVPLLKCMSAPEEGVRKLAAACFASVVALMPLAQGLPPPHGLDPNQLEILEREGGFLQQLLDNRKADDYLLPFPLKGVTLRRYQQEGINWLAFLRRFGLHGVLADDMGLGKTLQATSIVAATLHEQRLIHKASGADRDKPLPSLIVCPSTLVAHWEHEIAKFVDPSTLRPLQYNGPPAERAKLRPLLSSHDVLIMSYESLRSDVDWVASIKWSYCVLDEGHAVRNPGSKISQAVRQVPALHRLILSGTPIQNSTLELWALFDFLMPGFLSTYKDFNNRYGKAVGASRTAKKGSAEAQAGILALDSLHKQVMPFVLRRTKDQVLKDLPPKTITDLIFEPSELQKLLYEEFQGSQDMQQISATDLTGSKEAAPQHVFVALNKMRRLCSHPVLVLDSHDPGHVKAMARVLGPALASDWPAAQAHLGTHLEHSPKLAALKELLLDCGIGHDPSARVKGGDVIDEEEGAFDAGHRVLVFAQTKVMLDLAEKGVLSPMGVTHLRIDGDVEAGERFKRVQKFNADPTIDVMLLTTAVGGLGLNLTAADTVIFLEHDWNPQKDLQAMDRAHRLGQRRAVNVYRLLVRGTLEEDIMSLQRFKLDVAQAVVNTDNVSLAAMDTGNLLDLFGAAKEEAGKKEQGAGAPRSGLQDVLQGLEEAMEKAEEQYGDEFDLESFRAKVAGGGNPKE